MSEKRKIVFIAANPKNLPDTDWLSEYKVIEQVFNDNNLDSKFELKTAFDTTPDKFLKYVQGRKIWLIHYSCHGSDTGKIVLQDEQDKSFTVRESHFLDVIKGVQGLKCVLFASCNSDKLTEQTQHKIDYSIGFSGSILFSDENENKAAIEEFITNFYESFSKVESIPMAYRFTIERLGLKKAKNINVSFKCKNSIIMTAINSGRKVELEEMYTQQKSNSAELKQINADIETLETKVQTAKTNVEKEFWQLLEQSYSPSIDGVIWFNDNKKALADKVAELVMDKPENRPYFAEDLNILFDTVKYSLVMTENDQFDESVMTGMFTYDKIYYKSALDRLLEFVPECYSEDYYPYFKDNINYIKSLI